MNVNYNKLWKKLIELGWTKTQLKEYAGVSTNVIAKLGKNEAVSMDSVSKICNAMRCNVGDIMDIQNQDFDRADSVNTNGGI